MRTDCPFLKRVKEPRFVNHVRTVTGERVSQTQAGTEQLVKLVGERTTEGTPAQRRHQGKNKLLKHTHTHTQNSAPLKHVKNVVQLETATCEGRQLTRHDFWANSSDMGFRQRV